MVSAATIPRVWPEELRPGSGVCECGRCGERFGGLRAFDDHRSGPMELRTCLSPSAMQHRGYERDERGYWGRSMGAGVSAILRRTPASLGAGGPEPTAAAVP